jgi:hypothetical protein
MDIDQYVEISTRMSVKAAVMARKTAEQVACLREKFAHTFASPQKEKTLRFDSFEDESALTP